MPVCVIQAENSISLTQPTISAILLLFAVAIATTWSCMHVTCHWHSSLPRHKIQSSKTVLYVIQVTVIIFNNYNYINSKQCRLKYASHIFIQSPLIMALLINCAKIYKRCAVAAQTARSLCKLWYALFRDYRHTRASRLLESKSVNSI